MSSLPPKSDADLESTPPAYRDWIDHAYLSCLRLCSPNVLMSPSGLDTRGITLNGNLRLSAAPSGYRGVVITEMTSELRVMPGREVELIV
eukprot:scaffold117241_cov32-Tisochrysis_lutea.AAC.2